MERGSHGLLRSGAGGLYHLGQMSHHKAQSEG